MHKIDISSLDRLLTVPKPPTLTLNSTLSERHQGLLLKVCALMVAGGLIFSAPAEQLAAQAQSAQQTTASKGGQSKKVILKPLVPKTEPQPQAVNSQPSAPAEAQGEDAYPLIGQLEKMTFGFSKPKQAIKERLMVLEAAVFHKSFPQKTLAERTQQLSDTLLGPAVNPEPPPPRLQRAEQSEPKEFWQQPEFQTELPVADLEQFALEELNQQRANRGLSPLKFDETANKIAAEHVTELIKRKTISHTSLKGDNPDLRYTQAGGSDALSESLIALEGQDFKKKNKAAIVHLLQALSSHQDDRDALLSPDATQVGLSFGFNEEKQRLIACIETITKHAVMHPIPSQIKVGDKIEVKGVLLEPYKFDRITVAWEGNHSVAAEPDEESLEALPYFPPLDFVAYGQRSQQNHERAMNFLRMAGIAAAIAGGVFMPPVALAAPMIAMTGGNSEPHAVSEIPVHGGIKVDGSLFHGNVPISNSGKEGMYYVTVWASPSLEAHAVPISRRIVIAKSSGQAAEPISKADEPKPEISGSIQTTGSVK